MAKLDDMALAAALDALDVEGAEAVERASALHRQRRREESEEEARTREVMLRVNEDRPIVSMANWLDSEYYSGPFARNLYPKLKEVACEICDNNIHEVVMGGSIGWGKSTLARALHARSLYVLSRFANPHQAYRPMIETTPISMKNLNVNSEKAKSAYFTELRQTILSIPYFVDEFAPQKGVINQLRFPKQIICDFAGASKTAAESENLIFVVLDEINLYDDVEKSKRSDEGDKYDEAVEVHSAAYRRQLSRFMLPDGTMPEPCFLISLCKETYPESFIRRRMKEIRRDRLDEDVTVGGRVRKRSAIILEYAEWETKPPDFYEKSYFWVSTGTREREPRVYKTKQRASECRKEIKWLTSSGAEPDDVPRLIRVPLAGGVHLRAAEENLDEFIRDICGIPTEAIGQFLKNRRVLKEAHRAPGSPWPWLSIRPDKAKPEQRIPAGACDHPFTHEQTDFRDGARLIRERLARSERAVNVDGESYTRWEPLVAPGAPRYVHVDMGLSGDSAGVCVACPAGWVPRRIVTKDEDGREQVITVIEPLIWVDLMLRVNPPAGGGQIQFADIRQVVLMMQRLNFRFAHGSADGFQSANLLQDFQAMGMDAEQVSVDTSPDPYNNLRDLYTNRLVSTYEHEHYETEMRRLERRVAKVRTKGSVRSYESIDHPQKGSKDVSDAVAAATWNAYRYGKENAAAAPPPTAMNKEHENSLERKHKKGMEAREAVRKGNLEKLFDMAEEDGW